MSQDGSNGRPANLGQPDEPAPIGWDPRQSWTAQWIWSDDDGRATNQWRRFRAEFDVGADTVGVLRITADTRYQVWIDDSFVGEGPPLSFPHHTYVDRHAVPLSAGRHVIAVLVNHLGSWPEVTRAGLLAEVSTADGDFLCGTEPTWRVSTAPEFRSDAAEYWPKRVAPYQTEVDLRKADPGWRTLGHDDTGWQPASAVGGDGLSGAPARPGAAFPWSLLVPRDIPYPALDLVHPVDVTAVEECTSLEDRFGSVGAAAELSTVGRPVSRATATGTAELLGGGPATLQSSTEHLDPDRREHVDGMVDPFLTLDFGTVLTARIRMTISGPAGAIVDLGYAERLLDGRFNITTSAPFADRFILSGEDEELRTVELFGFRYLRLRVHSATGPVTITGLAAETAQYPFVDQGRLTSGGSILERVFEISRHTIRLCCVDAIVDTPWREAAQWVGDVAAVTLGGIYACFGDTALPEKFLRQSAATQLPRGVLPHFTNSPNTREPQVLADYSLWWVMAVWEHYRYTGDETIVHDLYPEVLRVMRYFSQHLNSDALLGDLSDMVFIDWAPVDRRGTSATVNAIHYGALRATSRMAALKGDAWTAERATGIADRVAAGFQRHFFDPERGVVVDGVCDGIASSTVSEHANAVALLWDLVDSDATASIIEHLWDRGPGTAPALPVVEAQPFFASFLLRALAHRGRMDLALDVIRRRWGDRMIERGATTTWEEWGMNGSWRDGEYRGFHRSLSHAWSAAPAEFLVTGLPGIEIIEPGCRRIRVAPPEGAPDFAVTWPTPLGPVHVERLHGRLTVQSPSGITVETPPDS